MLLMNIEMFYCIYRYMYLFNSCYDNFHQSKYLDRLLASWNLHKNPCGYCRWTWICYYYHIPCHILLDKYYTGMSLHFERLWYPASFSAVQCWLTDRCVSPNDNLINNILWYCISENWKLYRFYLVCSMLPFF